MQNKTVGSSVKCTDNETVGAPDPNTPRQQCLFVGRLSDFPVKHTFRYFRCSRGHLGEGEGVISFLLHSPVNVNNIFTLL